MKFIEIKPPNNSDIKGTHMIIPIDQFSAKGVNWVRQLVFKAEHVAVPFKEETFHCRYWGSPKYEVKNCGNTGSYAFDGSGWKDCECSECISGRIEVKNGWMPE